MESYRLTTFNSLITAEWHKFEQRHAEATAYNKALKPKLPGLWKAYEKAELAHLDARVQAVVAEGAPEPDGPMPPPVLKQIPRLQRHRMESACTMADCGAPIVWYHYTLSPKRTVPEFRFKLCHRCTADHWNKYEEYYKQQRGRA